MDVMQWTVNEALRAAPQQMHRAFADQWSAACHFSMPVAHRRRNIEGTDRVKNAKSNTNYRAN